MTFKDLDLSNQLNYAIEDLGFEKPTPIQSKAFSVVRSGKDMVGVAQTGTGKTFAYMMPILRDLKFSKQKHPRVLVLVPTRELVIQVVEEIEKLAKYINIRVLGVYGGTNINTQIHRSRNLLGNPLLEPTYTGTVPSGEIPPLGHLMLGGPSENFPLETPCWDPLGKYLP